MGLTVKTQGQRDEISRMLEKGHTCFWFYDEDECDGFYIDDYISFDEMARIVDFLRSQ